MARKRLTPAKPQFLDRRPDAPGANAGERSAADFTAGFGAGVSGPPIAQVAGEAAASSALRDLAEDVARARAEGRMVLEIPLDEIAPDHLARDRIEAGAEDMQSLITSIESHGQRTPIEVTQLADPEAGHKYGLISGWRRLAALEHLAKDSPARFGKVLALLRQPKDAADAYVSMVEENEIRVGLSYYERARVAVQAVERGVFETEKQALLALFATASRAKRSRIRVFTRLYHALDSVLRYPAAIPERLGLSLEELLRKTPERLAEIRATLTAEEPADAAQEIALLTGFLATPAAAKPAKAVKNVPRAEQKPQDRAQKLPGGLKIAHKAGQIEISGKGASAALYERLIAFLEGEKPQ